VLIELSGIQFFVILKARAAETPFPKYQFRPLNGWLTSNHPRSANFPLALLKRRISVIC
jgi:hypothetical protein